MEVASPTPGARRRRCSYAAVRGIGVPRSGAKERSRERPLSSFLINPPIGHAPSRFHFTE